MEIGFVQNFGSKKSWKCFKTGKLSSLPVTCKIIAGFYPQRQAYNMFSENDSWKLRYIRNISLSLVVCLTLS